MAFETRLKSDQPGQLDIEYSINGEHHQIFFKSDSIDFCWDASTQLCGTLLPSLIKTGHAHLASDIDPSLQDNVEKLCAIYGQWLDKEMTLTRAGSAESQKVEPLPAERGTGCFFTGGVDSFYTYLKNAKEITHIIYVHGFDVKLDQTEVRQQVSENLAAIANAFDVKLIEIETNFREIWDLTGPWGELTHGPALATIAHLLKRHISKVIIPASYTYNDLFMWGSHPITDPLWGDSQLSFVHDGCEARRTEKVAAIANSDIALKHLRVCYMTNTTEFNCGRCQKCQRTMINLLAAGALERCTTFPGAKLNFRKLKYITGTELNTRTFLKDNIIALSERKDPLSLKVRNALERSFNRPVLLRKAIRMVQMR
ncbi:hypothetical protein ACFSJ3_16570 [Corallincola platygyrae]|uniref:7-cyano-7-deazaguanine synthase n=1 Tax=Corallincola platygyrae TaxID=1193278 RepID=A0ABW4XRK0_9GAMM